MISASLAGGRGQRTVITCGEPRGHHSQRESFLPTSSLPLRLSASPPFLSLPPSPPSLPHTPLNQPIWHCGSSRQREFLHFSLLTSSPPSIPTPILTCMRQRLPELLAHKRHEGVQQP